MKNLTVGQKLSAQQALAIYEAASPEHGFFAGFVMGREEIVEGREYVVEETQGGMKLSFIDDVGVKQYIQLSSLA